MKMSRRERKIYNAGKEAGYIDGYTKGLHDGNPFVIIKETFEDIVKQITSNPELLEAALNARDDALIIEDNEGGDL